MKKLDANAPAESWSAAVVKRRSFIVTMRLLDVVKLGIVVGEDRVMVVEEKVVGGWELRRFKVAQGWEFIAEEGSTSECK